MFTQFLSILVSIALAQTIGQFDLLNLFEQFKTTSPDIIKAYQLVKIPDAWQKIKDIPSLNLNKVTIGIIDTGVDSGHQEFINPDINFGNTPPDALRDDPTIRSRGHGTQVAGIIGANNVLGTGGALSPGNPQTNGVLSGILPTQLYSLEVRGYQSFIQATLPISGFRKVTTIGKLNDVLKGINTNVTNLSIGLLKCSTFLSLNLPSAFGCVKDKYFNETTNFFKEGFESQPNTLFVIGAGNEDTNSSNETPANIKLENTLIVGATDLSEKRADFPFPARSSNFGSGVDISAPGIGVYASAMRGRGNFPQANGDYESDFSGTSASAPMVTGVAGLIKAIKPGLTPAQIKQILIETSDPIQTDKPIGGRLNALKAVCDPLVGLNCVPTPPPQPSNTWQSVGPMTAERAEHTSTLLNDGRVLITGGFKGNGFTFSELSSAEVFNPQTNTFSLVGNMSTPRTFHTATLLPNGKVLIAGGTKDGGNATLNSAELFDPQTNSFTSVSNLNQKRFFHTADLLPDGKVLIAGGVDGQPVKSTEIFDPNTNTFSLGSDMIKERAHHASAKLNDGRILLVNGLQTGSLMTVEIYNPNANSFTLATSSVSQLGLGAVTLPNGKVIISGSTLLNQPAGFGAEIFNPIDSSFIEVGPMLFAINGGGPRLASILLDDGAVLITGASLKALIFSPQTNLFSLTGDLNIPRLTRHRLTLLQDGRALLTGGQLSNVSFITTNGAEVFKR